MCIGGDACLYAERLNAGILLPSRIAAIDDGWRRRLVPAADLPFMRLAAGAAPRGYG
jgi:hypothetical protein